jgi:large subunit ribosomal protein L25
MDKMEKVVLKATRRALTGKKVSTLRREGKLPAVLYGHHFDSIPVLFDLKETSRQLSGLTSSSLITIDLDGTVHSALVREKQRDYIRGLLIHVDFQVVSLTEKIRADVSIEVCGTSPAVKHLNGVIVNGLTSVEVEGFPQDLPERFSIDISGLDAIGDAIYVRDLEVSEKVLVHSDPDEMIVTIVGGTTEEELAADTVGEGSEPEVIEKGKKEEE